MLFYQFTRPLAFRQIKHPVLRTINLFLPLSITVVLVLAYIGLPVRPALFGAGSVTGHLLSVLVILPGFFIAALAAVATFQRSELDEEMPTPAPTLEMRTGDQWAPVELTHRMFLCHLFAYLTVLSFGAIAIGVVGDLVRPSVEYCIGLIDNVVWACRLNGVLAIAYLTAFMWVSSNLVVVTLYGLYFLVERIHRPHS